MATGEADQDARGRDLRTPGDRTIGAAGAKAGAAERTLRSWLGLEALRAAYHFARRQVRREAGGRGLRCYELFRTEDLDLWRRQPEGPLSAAWSARGWRR